MLRSEFDTLSKSSKRPTDKEYELIEFVYNWHPLNFDKEAVAKLYDDFGMVIFYDMEKRSKLAMERDLIIKDYDNRILRLRELRAEAFENKLDGRLEDKE